MKRYLFNRNVHGQIRYVIFISDGSDAMTIVGQSETEAEVSEHLKKKKKKLQTTTMLSKTKHQEKTRQKKQRNHIKQEIKPEEIRLIHQNMLAQTIDHQNTPSGQIVGEHSSATLSIKAHNESPNSRHHNTYSKEEKVEDDDNRQAKAFENADAKIKTNRFKHKKHHHLPVPSAVFVSTDDREGMAITS